MKVRVQAQRQWGRPAVWVVLVLVCHTPAWASTWRGTAEVAYQSLPASDGRLPFWREYFEITLDDRLFVKNRLRLTWRVENRSFGGREPAQFRPRWTIELGGSGYQLQGFYAPFTLERDTAENQIERRYSLSLGLFPAGFPRATLAYDGLSRRMTGAGESSRNSYTLTAQHGIGPWNGQARLLWQDQRSTEGGVREALESALVGNDVALTWRSAHLSAGQRSEYSERRRTPGLSHYSSVHNAMAGFSISPFPSLRAGGDYSGRFVRLSGGSEPQTQNEHLASGQLNYRPAPFFEATALQYYSRSAGSAAPTQWVDFTQVRLGTNGRVFATVTGVASIYRTWNREPASAGAVNDAVYLQASGELYGGVRLSLETSYHDRNLGPQPVAIVRSIALQLYPARGNEWQLHHSSQGAADRWRLAAVDRQSLNLVLQQEITAWLRLSAGVGFVQDRAAGPDWQRRWLASSSWSVRRWMLVSGTYNQLETMRPVAGAPAVPESTRQKNLQVMLYPEKRLVATVTASETRRPAGTPETTWSGNLRYRF